MSIPFTWIYLMYDPFTDLYKIGKSDNPEERLKQLCNPKAYGTIPAAPTEYCLVEAWLCPERTEGELHEHFQSVRIRGEWFNLASYFEVPPYEEDEVRFRVGEMLAKWERLIEEGSYALERDSQAIYSLRCDLENRDYLLEQIESAKLLGYLPPEPCHWWSHPPTVLLEEPVQEVSEDVAF